MPDGGAIPPRPKPPAQLEALIGAIGEAGVLRLIETRGGTVVYVPGRTLSSKRGLGRQCRLDDDACRRLAQMLGNDRVKVPLARRWRAQIYRADGLSYTKIALKLGVTESAVWNYLRDGKLTNQLSLDI